MDKSEKLVEIVRFKTRENTFNHLFQKDIS